MEKQLKPGKPESRVFLFHVGPILTILRIDWRDHEPIAANRFSGGDFNRSGTDLFQFVCAGEISKDGF
jgi:hypothetical protein